MFLSLMRIHGVQFTPYDPSSLTSKEEISSSLILKSIVYTVSCWQLAA